MNEFHLSYQQIPKVDIGPIVGPDQGYKVPQAMSDPISVVDLDSTVKSKNSIRITNGLIIIVLSMGFIYLISRIPIRNNQPSLFSRSNLQRKEIHDN